MTRALLLGCLLGAGLVAARTMKAFGWVLPDWAEQALAEADAPRQPAESPVLNDLAEHLRQRGMLP